MTVKILDEDKQRIKILNEIGAIHKELDKMEQTLATVKNTRAAPSAISDAIVRNESRGRILRIKLDSLHKKLNKVWADKRSTEFTGGKDLFGNLADSLRGVVRK